MSQKKMFETKCSDCKKTTMVSFEPTKGRPVYCKTCYQKHKKNQQVKSRKPISFDMKNAWARREDKIQTRKPEHYSVFKKD
jgi:CxxC-x17-CxxC domain-containing protein